MEDFEKELKQTFLEEATQLLSFVEEAFLELETSTDRGPLIEKIFRLAHNIKGSANGVGFSDVGEFTHNFETFLLALKNGKLTTSAEVMNLMLRCTDHITTMINELKTNLDARFDSSAMIRELQDHLEGRVSAAPPSNPAIEGYHSFDEEAEPEPEPKNTAYTAPTPPAPAAEKKTQASVTDESIRVSLQRVEKLIDFVGELVILEAVLKEQMQQSGATHMKRTVDQVGKVTKEVQDIAMGLRMVPVKPLFQKLQRIVRDTSAALGKTIQFQMIGADTELDKTVIEKISDPLVHLVRNACDHGIENPEQRQQANKPEQGTVTLSAYRQSGKLVIEVKDDGGGIDGKKLTNIAIQKGILRPGTELPEKEGVNLIFHPGFSTKAQVTDVSGRGVGMDVVKTNIEEISGTIQIDTTIGKGTDFKVFLPMTLAIIDAMIVKASEERYVIPLSHVHESVRLSNTSIQQVPNLGEVLLLRGENLPLFDLSQVLKRKPSAREKIQKTAIVIRTMEQPYAILVDDILSRNQVVIKQLGKEAQHLRGFSGSTILGDGKPSLILELDDLISRNKAQGRPDARSRAA